MSSERSPDHLPDDITVDEYKDRVARVQARMTAERLDALLITSEDNYRYLTGFDSPTWQNLTRPRYCVVPRTGDPVLIVPASNTVIADRTSWVPDVRSWMAPCPADDGVSLVIDALKDCVGGFDRVGAELGPESRLTMPVGDFLRIKEAVAPVEIVDGDWLLRRRRMVKSPAEVAHMRHVAQVVSQAFEALPGSLYVGQSEWEACRALQVDLLRRGVEKIVYLVGTSGWNGYQCINLGPSQTVLADGYVLIIDTGCSYKGYYCDFDREYSFGPPSDRIRRAYDIVWRATQAGIDAVRPGRRTSDIWQAQAQSIAADKDKLGNGVEMPSTGRLGHGVGLRMCEPPSIHPDDDTVLEPGMTLTIEPGIAFVGPGRNGPEKKVMIHEENVLVTEDGCELLTRRAPPEMPVVG
jgi:Xaa-Pro aminopeptidase